jgi:hypothetical protein
LSLAFLNLEVRGVSGKRYITCRPIGKFFMLIVATYRRPWSFTYEPCLFDSGRTGFVWVRCVWNGSSDPKSRQMRGAFRRTISQRRSWTSSGNSQIVAGPRAQRFPLVSSPIETSRWEKFRRRWWSARRSRDVVQRAGGRLLWLGDFLSFCGLPVANAPECTAA